MNTLNPFRPDSWLLSTRGKIALILFAVAAVYLITEHTAHVLQVLPYGLMLLCPLLHLFMHGGHGNNTGQDGTENHTHHQDKR